MKERAMAGGPTDAENATEEQPATAAADTTRVLPAPPPATDDATRELVAPTDEPGPTQPAHQPPNRAATAEAPTAEAPVEEPTGEDTRAEAPVEDLTDQRAEAAPVQPPTGEAAPYEAAPVQAPAEEPTDQAAPVQAPAEEPTGEATRAGAAHDQGPVEDLTEKAAPAEAAPNQAPAEEPPAKAAPNQAATDEAPHEALNPAPAEGSTDEAAPAEAAADQPPAERPTAEAAPNPAPAEGPTDATAPNEAAPHQAAPAEAAPGQTALGKAAPEETVPIPASAQIPASAPTPAAVPTQTAPDQAIHPHPQPAAPTPAPTSKPAPAPAPTPPPTPAPTPAPLDLLAQLTNTPPPPATPARTLARRVKIWTPLVALLGLVLLTVQIVRPLPEPTFTLAENTSSFTFSGDPLALPWPEEGQAAVTVVGSGRIGTFGAEKPVPTASVAKIMTAYVILREHPLKKNEKGPLITVDPQAVEEGTSEHESRIEGLKVGQTFSQQDMLKMLMIPSGNNVGRLLARWDTASTDEKAFVRKMNDAAKALGMKNTTYTDPSGLDKGTVSTAVDQLKLAEEVMKYDAFRAIVAMPNADIPGIGRINNNNDRLLVAGLSIRGIKTGSNTPAGGTLSWAAYKTVDGKDRLILGTMMDQHAPPPDPNGANSLVLVQDNSKKVIEAVRTALTSAPAVTKGQVVGHIDNGLGGRTPVIATKDLKAVGVPGQKLAITFHNPGKSIPHTAQAGTVIGELTIGTGPNAPRTPVALKTDLTEPSLTQKLTRLG
ncbi:D-alanyl-D-alanine carboxypeptidase [Streptomyces sp. NPDC049837]|uniref:D-alanyl-D-alanine carboxypeptidase n=1 Tax=Streptomyces sp. NPDC049837 TaxID=3155277 RepID=UPI0034436189